MIFASTPTHNTDPSPWICQGVSDPALRLNDENRLSCDDFVPRPEFDQPRAHDANPILLQHRRAPERAIYWRDMITEPSQDEKDHAHRVLSRLARVRALAAVSS
jgi:hypothetical protein